jgi:O-antigen/teichoic acid export membrane protein
MKISRSSATAWALIQGGNALSIVCGILIARTVSPYEFARFATLSAALAIMTSFLNPLINELAHRVAATRAIHPNALIKRTAYSSAICMAIATTACLSIVRQPLEIFLVCIAIPLSLVGHSWIFAILSGLHRMIAYGWTLVASSVVRLGILIPFLITTPHLAGFAWSYLAGFVVTVLLARICLGPRLQHETTDGWSTNWVLLLGFFLLALPFSLDQPIIQLLFPDRAADYAAVMTYGKSVMLLASPALAIAYSSALQVGKSSPSSMRSLPPIVVVVLLATLFAFALWVIHPWLFPLLLGTQYLHAMSQLSIALPAMALYVVSHYLLQILLISSRWWICILLVIPSLLQILLFARLSEPTITQLMSVSLCVFAVQFVFACVASALHHPRTGHTT